MSTGTTSVGDLFLLGFEGTAPDAALREWFEALRPGGVVLFGRNILAPEQVAELTAALQRWRGERPLLVAVDQEGGRVSRFGPPFTVLPGNGALGRAGDVALAERVGRVLGTELGAVGVTLNLAPVLDLRVGPGNPVLGERCLGEDSASVAALGAALVRGMQGAGVGATAKHFPGHGGTAVDSHEALPVVPAEAAWLTGTACAPFRAAVAAEVAGIMTAHVCYPALDPDLPATFSPRILGLLRRDLGFGGVVMSDDLGMGAIARTWPVEEAAVLALQAGADAILIAADASAQARARAGVEAAVAAGRLPAARLAEAAARLAALRRKVGLPRPLPPGPLRAVLGCGPHQATASALARWAV
ncbi:MAG TPA: beta-N-acetylhexosaminidase [Candidatus Methylomirabilis sp.]|jgi:beta-N-acetylhexosaminidase|nr:beta-N-acetylhexosaminidase [Candidatus Methylomirabilis sp.]